MEDAEGPELGGDGPSAPHPDPELVRRNGARPLESERNLQWDAACAAAPVAEHLLSRPSRQPLGTKRRQVDKQQGSLPALPGYQTG